MTIVDFTPLSALIGGLMIGAAGVMLLWLNGRMAGISGIFGSVISTDQSDNAWRILFLVGLVLGGFVWMLLGGDVGAITITAGMPELIGAGLLVGFGTQLGSGCTSGHGVCGIGRLSPRGLVSTLIYMFTGALVIFVLRIMAGG
jgi:uncharacterized membrane protein YedE/YeeE